jgi:hypothetical protein
LAVTGILSISSTQILHHTPSAVLLFESENRIIDTTMLLSIDKKNFHRRCAQCGNPIGVGKFQERNGKPYCENHAEGTPDSSRHYSSSGSIERASFYQKKESTHHLLYIILLFLLLFAASIHTRPFLFLNFLEGPVCARCKQQLRGQV